MYKRILCVLFCAVIASQCWAWKPEKGELPLAPDNYEYVDGSMVFLESLKGKPTVLYFGGDWCPPCVQTRPYVLNLAKEYGKELNIVFFSSDDNGDRHKKLLESQAGGYLIAMPKLALYPVGHRPKGDAQIGAFGRIYTFPTAVVLDREGRVVQKYERGSPIRSDLAVYVRSMFQSK